MASYTYEELKVLTVVKLREIAQGVQSDALEGFSTMHKEQLLPTLCKVLHVPTHHAAAGQEKTRIKCGIRKLKVQRDAAIAAHDPAKLATVRRHIHALKHKLRRMAALADRTARRMAAGKPAEGEKAAPAA
jgi:hypothetical protein